MNSGNLRGGPTIRAAVSWTAWPMTLTVHEWILVADTGQTGSRFVGDGF